MVTATKKRNTQYAIRRTKVRPKVGVRWRKLLCCLPGYDPFCQSAGCWFDADIARYYIDFIEECCTHVEGELAGKPFLLERWEKAIVANFFGWQRIDAYNRQARRYREVFIYVARKNGKTPLCAAIMNAAFFMDDEAGQQNYCAAGERDQATLSFIHINGMQDNEIEMSCRVRAYKSSRTIVKNDDQSFIKVLSSDAKTKHGGNPHCVLVDELHVQPNRRLVDVFQTAMSSINRKQSFIMYLTTADYKRESICNEKYEEACKVRDNKGDKSKVGFNPTFLPVIYEAGQEDDWSKLSTWKKANPNLNVSKSIEYMQKEYRRAKETPTYENTFKRLDLNLRTDQDILWLPADLWDGCNFVFDEKDLVGRKCFAAFDLSSNTDTAGYGLLFPPDPALPEGNTGRDKWIFLPRIFVPRDNAEKREDRDEAPYITWARQELLTLTAGNVVDYETIRESFWKDAERFDIVEIAFDRWNIEGERQRFIKEGIPEEKFVSFGQGFASMSAPSKELEKLLLAKEIAHGGHPVLSWMASNVTVEIDHSPASNIKPIKKESKGRIDGIVMLVMALGRAMVTPGPVESVYEKRGIITID